MKSVDAAHQVSLSRGRLHGDKIVRAIATGTTLSDVALTRTSRVAQERSALRHQNRHSCLRFQPQDTKASGSDRSAGRRRDLTFLASFLTKSRTWPAQPPPAALALILINAAASRFSLLHYLQRCVMNQADTAWMLVSTALVLLMTPALAFFYGGLVRSKNALNTMMMSFISLGFVGVLWAVIGYSLAFAPGNNYIGDLSRLFLRGVGLEAQGTIPALSLHGLSGHVLHHHGGAHLRRHRRAHAVLGLSRFSSSCGRCSSTHRSRTGCGAAAGWPTWARSTSPAAPSCT